ncbi:MAG TPA: GNAT family N-acetyltransferase [Chitinophagaceae bacterium]|nr:GNAT family N-acetyltransferase [Chitinophagaceae bacterium]
MQPSTPSSPLSVSDHLHIRTILPSDNEALARVVRDTMAEFGVNRPGTVYFDPTTDHLFELFQQPRSIYYVAELDHTIVGGAGIYPSNGLPPNVCELVKMYLRPAARGLGVGRQLIAKSIEFARSVGYKQIYLETMPELKQAMKVYEKFGWKYLNGPMGNTGHFGCDKWMLMKL